MFIKKEGSLRRTLSSDSINYSNILNSRPSMKNRGNRYLFIYCNTNYK